MAAGNAVLLAAVSRQIEIGEEARQRVPAADGDMLADFQPNRRLLIAANMQQQAPRRGQQAGLGRVAALLHHRAHLLTQENGVRLRVFGRQG